MADDLKADMKNSKTLAQTSLWFDKYARRIERLPTLNVDKELVKYSAFRRRSVAPGIGGGKDDGNQVRRSSSADYGR